MKPILVAASALFLVACASGGGAGPSAVSARPGSGDVITTEEIASLDVSTATEVVRRLRPHWLRNRGPVSLSGGGGGTPVVYIDEVRAGGLEALDRITVNIVQEMRFISGQDASVKYGLNHGGGVIMVVTRRR